MFNTGGVASPQRHRHFLIPVLQQEIGRQLIRDPVVLHAFAHVVRVQFRYDLHRRIGNSTTSAAHSGSATSDIKATTHRMRVISAHSCPHLWTTLVDR